MDVWREKFETYKIPIALCLVGFVLILGGMFASSKSSQDFSPPKESIVDSNTSQITVDISGAVKTPGVYKLPSDSRIADAVSAAGGFTEDANNEFVSKYLNLAQKVADGSKLYIPHIGEKDTDLAVSKDVAGVASHGQVNINSASQASLEALPGIGPVTAKKIIDNRPYQSIEVLLSKKVLGKSVYEKIKESVVTY